MRSRDLTDEERDVVVRAFEVLHGRSDGPCDRDLVVQVARLLLANPTASANAVAAVVRWRRQDVLAVVRELRAPVGPVPAAGNRHDGVAPDGEVRS